MSGETEAFMELVNEHDRSLRVLAYRLLHDRVAMDDVMQDAYLKAFRAFSGFRGEAQVRTWLYRIVYNACLDRVRSDARRREVPLEVLTAAETGARTKTGIVDDPTDPAVLRGDLAAALAALPADQRAAVLLVDAVGFPHEEAAGVLGVRPGTIASRLHHARSALRTTLGEGRDHETV
jgi:RNA polymerase sigma-70 factor (ECF subfamily)